ncbi:MAG: YeeE/YedE family protein [Helicobacteraceae bacterium]|jgi:uncharacterized membrane protein YedE/YeeE|nr:YeeE/YedE family protein [Helicobacteraceae bacterium]
MKLHHIAALLFALLSLCFIFWSSAQDGGRAASFAFVCGLAFGVTMQRSRFCFYCHLREWFDDRNPRGALALLAALAVGLIGYTIVVGGWMPNPSSLPPDIHVGPVSEIIVLAGFVFGLGMVISESCISAHWCHFAGGSLFSLSALIGTAIGFFLGFNSWNALYSYRLAESPIVWLPSIFGHGGALIVQLGALAVIAAFVIRRGVWGEQTEPPRAVSIGSIWRRLWQQQWSYPIGGLIIGLIAIAMIERAKPLGVTATVASWTRKITGEFGLIPPKLNGLDGFAGCGSLPQNFWFNVDSLLLLGLFVGALIAALGSGSFALEKIGFKDTLRALAGGVLMGLSAMIALGCTIGTLLSGVHSGALSGWLFGAAMLIAIWSGLKVKKRLFS